MTASRIFFWVAMSLTLPLLYFVVDRSVFVWSSQPVASTVESISAENDRCGSRKRRYRCTKFSATLKYRVDGVTYSIVASAGSARGHDRPSSEARHHIDEQVRVIYDVRTPARAYRDMFWDIWGAPVLNVIIQVCAFIASLSERQRESRGSVQLDRAYLARSGGRSQRR